MYLKTKLYFTCGHVIRDCINEKNKTELLILASKMSLILQNFQIGTCAVIKVDIDQLFFGQKILIGKIKAKKRGYIKFEKHTF